MEPFGILVRPGFTHLLPTRGREADENNLVSTLSDEA
jgi:hypothetical protein